MLGSKPWLFSFQHNLCSKELGHWQGPPVAPVAPWSSSSLPWELPRLSWTSISPERTVRDGLAVTSPNPFVAPSSPGKSQLQNKLPDLICIIMGLIWFSFCLFCSLTSAPGKALVVSIWKANSVSQAREFALHVWVLSSVALGTVTSSLSGFFFLDVSCPSQWPSGTESSYQCRRCKRHGFDPWVGKIPWS